MNYYTFMESPAGRILLVSNGRALTGLYLEQHRHGPEIGRDWIEDPGAQPFPQARAQLAAYFAGELCEFDLPLAPQGTPFQRQVWASLQQIPYGTTVSYKALAAQIGRPGSIRAVGQANGRNPISIIIPCHRVIGANGALTGYGGGLDRKAALLEHEAAVLAGNPAR